MPAILTIEKRTLQPGCTLTSVSIPEGNGLDIGRSAAMGWMLPDPRRYISGKHCEIRHRGGNFWLYDVSTNGTFLNGEVSRMRSPYVLRSGDRIAIGDYVVAVAIEEETQVSVISLPNASQRRREASGMSMAS